MSLFTSIIAVTNKDRRYYFTAAPCWAAFMGSFKNIYINSQENDEFYSKIEVGIFTNGKDYYLTNNTLTNKENIKKYLEYIGKLFKCPLIDLEDYSVSLDYLNASYDTTNYIGIKKKPSEYTNNILNGYKAIFNIEYPVKELTTQQRSLFFRHFGPLVRISYENTYNPILNSVIEKLKGKPWFSKYFTFYELLYLTANNFNLNGQGHSAWAMDIELPSPEKFFKKILKPDNELSNSMFECFNKLKDIIEISTLKNLIKAKDEEELLKNINKLINLKIKL